MKAWIARDKDGKLHIFEDKPVKNTLGGYWFSQGFYQDVETKWEDEEPAEIILKPYNL